MAAPKRQTTALPTDTSGSGPLSQATDPLILERSLFDVLPIACALVGDKGQVLATNLAWKKLEAEFPVMPALRSKMQLELEEPTSTLRPAIVVLGDANLAPLECRLAQICPLPNSAERLLSLMPIETVNESYASPTTSESKTRGAFVLDRKSGHTYLNPVAMRIICDTPTKLTGLQKVHFDLLSAFESRSRIEKAIKEMETGKRDTFETKTAIKSSTGEQKWIWLSLDLYRQAGMNLGIRGVFMEITKEQERSLRLEKIFASLNTHRLLTTGNDRGLITWANDEFCKKTGYDLDELLGQPYSLLKSGHHPKAFFDEIWSCVRSGRTWRGEIRNLRKDGELCEFDTLIIPLSEPGSTRSKGAPFFLTIAEDVSYKLSMERQLESERQIQSSRAKFAQIGEVSSGIAHEITNPLTIIMGQLQALTRALRSGDSEAAQNRVNRIQCATERIVRIVANLKKLSRMEASDTLGACDVPEIINDSVGFIGDRLHVSGVKLECSIDPEIFAWARAAELSQVLVNLIGNAIDAIESMDEPWIRVEARKTSTQDPFVDITVTDSGSGIPESVSAKIFEPFFTTKDIGKGTGLGLFLCRTIIDRMNGSLNYEKRNGHTCFCIRVRNFGFHKTANLSHSETGSRKGEKT